MEHVTRREFLGLSAAGALGGSALGFDIRAASQVRQHLRIEGATVSRSLCPYCAVGCSLLAYTKKTGDDGRVDFTLGPFGKHVKRVVAKARLDGYADGKLSVPVKK